MADDKKATYSKPASQVDLEARREEDYQPSTVRQYGDDPSASKDGFVGVDPVYQNYSDHLGAPQPSGGAEGEILKNFVAEDAEYPDLTDGEAGGEPIDEETEEPAKSSTSTGGTAPSSSTPPSA